jgi:hypothetical protein
MGGREEGLLHDVADAAVAYAVAGGDADNGDDGAGDVDELGGEVDGDDGLEVEVEEGLVLIGSVGIEVELEGDRDDVATGFWVSLARFLTSGSASGGAAAGFGAGGAWQRLVLVESTSRIARANRIRNPFLIDVVRRLRCCGQGSLVA